MAQLTPEIIAFIKDKKSQKLFLEILLAWDIHANSLYRWLNENRSDKLTHPKTINLIRKYNTQKIRICQDNRINAFK